MKISSLLASLSVVALAAALPAMAGAQNAPGPSTPAKVHKPRVQIARPIKVTNCSPQRSTAYVAGGYAPAFYPGGPYWGWPSVYGPTYYSYPVHGDPTLSIDYANNTNVTMTDVEFGLIANGNLVAEVRDKGTFSPGAVIKHQFGLNPNVFPLATGLPKCVPLKITFADGTAWRNPHLPALRRSIYGRPH